LNSPWKYGIFSFKNAEKRQEDTADDLVCKTSISDTTGLKSEINTKR